MPVVKYKIHSEPGRVDEQNRLLSSENINDKFQGNPLEKLSDMMTSQLAIGQRKDFKASEKSVRMPDPYFWDLVTPVIADSLLRYTKQYVAVEAARNQTAQSAGDAKEEKTEKKEEKTVLTASQIMQCQVTKEPDEALGNAAVEGLVLRALRCAANMFEKDATEEAVGAPSTLPMLPEKSVILPRALLLLPILVESLVEFVATGADKQKQEIARLKQEKMEGLIFWTQENGGYVEPEEPEEGGLPQSVRENHLVGWLTDNVTKLNEDMRANFTALQNLQKAELDLNHNLEEAKKNLHYICFAVRKQQTGQHLTTRDVASYTAKATTLFLLMSYAKEWVLRMPGVSEMLTLIATHCEVNYPWVAVVARLVYGLFTAFLSTQIAAYFLLKKQKSRLAEVSSNTMLTEKMADQKTLNQKIIASNDTFLKSVWRVRAALQIAVTILRLVMLSAPILIPYFIPLSCVISGIGQGLGAMIVFWEIEKEKAGQQYLACDPRDPSTYARKRPLPGNPTMTVDRFYEAQLIDAHWARYRQQPSFWFQLILRGLVGFVSGVLWQVLNLGLLGFADDVMPPLVEKIVLPLLQFIAGAFLFYCVRGMFDFFFHPKKEPTKGSNCIDNACRQFFRPIGNALRDWTARRTGVPGYFDPAQTKLVLFSHTHTEAAEDYQSNKLNRNPMTMSPAEGFRCLPKPLA